MMLMLPLHEIKFKFTIFSFEESCIKLIFRVKRQSLRTSRQCAFVYPPTRL